MVVSVGRGGGKMVSGERKDQPIGLLRDEGGNSGGEALPCPSVKARKEKSGCSQGELSRRHPYAGKC